MAPTYLKACINGARRRSEHPAVPVTAAQVAADVAVVARLGVDAVHVHVKDPRTGADTLNAADLAHVLRQARHSAPDLPLGVTTGAWAEPKPSARLAAIEHWTVLPDFASVNWHEHGAEQISTALLDRGVGVEAGLWNIEAAHAWRDSPLREQCVRALLELQDGPGETETLAEADRLLAVCEPLLPQAAIILHGEGSSCWPALRYAFHRGLGSRIGLEDTLVLPNGNPADNNAALVAAAQRVSNTSTN